MSLSTGIRQREDFDPILFNVTDEIREIKSVDKCRIGSKEMKIFCYINDEVIISEKEDNLQISLHRFKLKAKK